MTDEEALVPLPSAEFVQSSEVPALLKEIRPEWQAKSLIQRVYRLLPVDPSSACQRIFNAAVHDLREKVDIAGLDVAKQAAELYKLPPISSLETLEDYPTAKLIDVAYRMGLLTRPEWRRLSRCYEIRRDLEHEDNEYEAEVVDCVYIFRTCIDVVLSRDPIQAIRITDVKDLVNQPNVAEPTEELTEDYEHAPQPRQEEICKFLISTALDEEQAEIVRQNAQRFLAIFAQHTHNQVKLNLAHFAMDKIGRKSLSRQMARVCIAAGIFGYLREKQREDFFLNFLSQMREVGVDWDAFSKHGVLLRNFQDCGGLIQCPASVRRDIVNWMVLTYIGTSGGVTRWGNVRHVFYSNTAAPLIAEMFKRADGLIADDVRNACRLNTIKQLCRDQHIARRFEELVDFVELADQ
jgi:hypothetical protein